MNPGASPPARRREHVSTRERELIVGALGPVDDEVLLRAVRDGRGRDFQRLELLGDSVLDLILAVHRWAEPDCSMPDTEESASDAHLAKVARAAGLGDWLEWSASDDRIADLVETCVAVAWLLGGWSRAAHFAAGVVHPLGDRSAALLVTGGPAPPSGREARRVGAAVLELAAASGLYERLPLADEGELSTRRAQIHRTERVAAHARQRDPRLHGDDDRVVSRVEDLLAVRLAADGADGALNAARPLLGFAER